MLLNMVDFDVILGMNLLSTYYVILDYISKTITLDITRIPSVAW